MEEAENILDCEGSRYILDGEHVVPAVGALEVHHRRDGDGDGLRRERVMHRDQDVADLVIVDINVGLRGLGGSATGFTENMSRTDRSPRMPPVLKSSDIATSFTPAVRRTGRPGVSSVAGCSSGPKM